MSLVELAENNSRSWSERWAVHHHKDLLLLWFGCYPCCRSSRMSALCSPCGFHLTWSQSPGNEPCSALPPAPGACLPHAATWAPQLHNTMLLVVFLSDVLRSQGSFFLVSKKKKKPSPEKDVTLSATIQFLCALPLSAGLKFGLKVLPSELSYKPYFCRFQNLPKKGNKWTAEDHTLPFLILPPCSAPWITKSVVKRFVLCWSSNLKPGNFSKG